MVGVDAYSDDEVEQDKRWVARSLLNLASELEEIYGRDVVAQVLEELSGDDI